MPRTTVNGLRLNVLQHGGGRPLLLLHGFTGSAESWRDLAEALSPAFDLAGIDLLGHGLSDCPPDPSRYRMERIVEDLVALLRKLTDRPVHLVGYSMGGRIALQLALAHAEIVRSLVLESASPGIADPGERAARVRSDEALARMLESEGVEPFVSHWEQIPLFASQSRIAAEARERLRADRLRRDACGLAQSLRGCGAGVAPAVVDRLHELTMPTLLVVGELDEKYRQLGETMAERIPRAELVVVPEAGHTVHLEQPAAYAEAVRRFLEEKDGERLA